MTVNAGYVIAFWGTYEYEVTEVIIAIGALNEQRLDKFIDRFESLCEDREHMRANMNGNKSDKVALFHARHALQQHCH